MYCQIPVGASSCGCSICTLAFSDADTVVVQRCVLSIILRAYFLGMLYFSLDVSGLL